jgi:hypothetical protein
MKRLLFLIFFLSAIAFGQTNPLADEVRVQGLKDTLETRIDSTNAAIGTISGTANTRIDSILTPLAAAEDSIDKHTDSLQSHNDRINALLDTAKFHSDTLLSHNDRILALLDSVNNHYSQAILDILLAAKFDKADTTDYYTEAMVNALLAYKFDKSDTSSYYKAVYLDALLNYYFLKSDTTDYYKDVMVDALLGYKLNLTDTSYQVQDSYLTALLPYYYVRTDTSSATLGFYPRNMIDAKIAEITGTGVITLNGLSGVTQTLAIDTTIAGAPAWSSVGTTHTLQLPFLRFWKKAELDTASRWQPLGLPFDTTGRWQPLGLPFDTTDRWQAKGLPFDTTDRWNPKGLPFDTTGRWAPAGEYFKVTLSFPIDSSMITITDTIWADLPERALTVDSISVSPDYSGDVVSYVPKFLYRLAPMGTITAIITSPATISTSNGKTVQTTINNATLPANGQIGICHTDVTTKPKFESIGIKCHY